MTIDMTSITDPAELEALIQAAAARHEQLRAAQADTEQRRRQRVADAVTSLEALLGPTGATPGQGSIRAMLGYDDATLAQHAGLALRLVLLGMEQLTATTRDIALIAGRGC